MLQWMSTVNSELVVILTFYILQENHLNWTGRALSFKIDHLKIELCRSRHDYKESTKRYKI